MNNTWNFSPAGGTQGNCSRSIPQILTGNVFAGLNHNIKEYDSLKICLDAKYIEELLKVGIYGKAKLNFRKVGMADIPTLRKFFSMSGRRTCDYSLGGVMMWIDYFQYEMAVYDETLFLKGFDKEREETVFYAPVGKLSREDAAGLIREYGKAYGGKAVVVDDKETTFEDYCQKISGDKNYRDSWKEYLYEIEKFINFPGKKMEKKRNHLHYFLKNYENISVEEISDNNCGELISFTKDFERNHDESLLFDYEVEQTIKVLENYSAFGFTGILLRQEGKVIGYTFGELTGDTFHVHVEKGNIFYQGVYQMLASTLAGVVAGKFGNVRYLNREEDMGDESLRKSKESYHPAVIVNKRITGIG